MTYIIRTTYIVLRTPIRHLLWTGICYRVFPFSFCYWWVLWLFMYFHWYRFALLRCTRTSNALRNAHSFLKACLLFEHMSELDWNLCALNGECENKDSGIIFEVGEESMHEQTYHPFLLYIESQLCHHIQRRWYILCEISFNSLNEQCELSWYDVWLMRSRSWRMLHAHMSDKRQNEHSLTTNVSYKVDKE